MADNIELDAGSGGSVIATDDDGAAQHQYVKVEFGADNTQTKVTSTVGLPVKLLAGTAEFGKLAAGTAEIGNITNSGIFAVQSTLQAGTAEIGKLAAGTAEIGSVTNSGTFAVQSTLQTGSNAIGKLAANSGVDIGDVDVTSITLPRSQIGPGEPGTAVDSYTQVAINLTTGADQVLVSSAPNKQIWVYGYAFTCGDANGQSVSLQDEDDVPLTGIMEFAQYGGISVPPSGNFSMPVFKLGTDKDLEIDITGGDVDGWLVYAILSV